MLTSNLSITGDNQRRAATIRVAGISDKVADLQGRGRFVPTQACARWYFEGGIWGLVSFNVSGAPKKGGLVRPHRFLWVWEYPWVAELVERMRPSDPGADDLHIARRDLLAARADLAAAEAAYDAIVEAHLKEARRERS